MNEDNNPLSLFLPLLKEWFTAAGRTPTSAQAAAWPLIARGDHVLVSSPTGSGKTLAAFLWAINRLVTGEWSPGSVRVLYISPLKALNNDVRENLLVPLAELRRMFESAGQSMPEIGVMTRSGDTPQSERSRMSRRPPQILITTPESLNIMIATKKTREIFRGTATVIMDEIHALAGTKRGAHMITAVERLVPLAGEFQRIALSATVRPLDTVARFVGGYRMDGSERTVRIVESGDEKRYAVSVKTPDGDAEEGTRWPAVIRRCRREMAGHASTLVFVNSRRLAEKTSHYINEQDGETISYPHHGSLSRELRHAVESRLKKGDLQCIVATNSLELGIDVGALESIILVQSPFSVSSALQKIGRSGHGVGEVSHGVIIPLHGRDYIDAAVISDCVMRRDIEPVAPVRSPLDVLAQLILAMTLEEPVPIDFLYDMVRCSYTFHELSRKHFDLVLEMLAGRYAGTRVRELRGLLTVDAMDGTAAAKKGARYLLYSSGGTIPERGYFGLRMQGSMAKIGELDEEFVWERALGDTFSLGSAVWRIREITHSDVIVAPAEAKPGIIPFWKNEPKDRDFHFSERISLFLENADRSLDDPGYIRELVGSYGMEEAAADEMISYLRLQRKIAGSLPHRHNLLIERYRDPAGGGEETQVFLHTLWGGRVNRPVAMAVAAAWKKRYGHRLELYVNNDTIMLTLPSGFDPAEIIDMIRPGELIPSLREVLEETAYFGARFRENAGRALLLPRASISRRYPLWLNRLRAKKLLDAVKGLDDFPILLETWRTCLKDDFDLEHAEAVMEELKSGAIGITESVTAVPSPFAGGIVYRQIEKYMYEDDRPLQSGPSRLAGDLIREVALDASMRPAIDAGTIGILDRLLKRTAPGYSPSSPEDLLDWLVQRILVPEPEWAELTAAMERDHGPGTMDAAAALSRKAVKVRPPGAAHFSPCAMETVPSLAASLGLTADALEMLPLGGGAAVPEPPPMEARITEPEIMIAQFLSYYGPVAADFLREVFGFAEVDAARLIESLAERDIIVTGGFSDPDRAEICDRENLERLIRLSRKKRRPTFAPLPAVMLHPFLAAHHGLTGRAGGRQALEESLERLFGYPCQAELWEEAVFPARISGYQTSWLDSLMLETGLAWLGCGYRRLTFIFPDDMELFDANGTGIGESPLSAHLDRKISFLELVAKSGLNTEAATEILWTHAWSGAARNDAFAAVRNGIANRFSSPFPSAPPKGRQGGTGRRGFSRWRATRPIAGSWIAADYGLEPADEMERDERNRDRVRLLLNRYGILFRELLEKEIPSFRWGDLFRTMRLMELSGEITAGLFFEGIGGLQFISPEGLRLLQKTPHDAPYWMNACDPASLCGAGLKDLGVALPPRVPSNWLVFRGSRLLMVLRRDGRDLDITVEPDEPALEGAFAIFDEFITRDYNPMGSVLVETIKGMPATESPYASTMLSRGFRKTYRGLELLRKY